MNDCTNRLNGGSLVAQRPLGILEPGLELSADGAQLGGRAAARRRGGAKRTRSRGRGSPGFLARTPRSTCSNVMYASNARGRSPSGEPDGPARRRSRAGAAPGRILRRSRRPLPHGRSGRRRPVRALPVRSGPDADGVQHRVVRHRAGRGEAPERGRHLAPGCRQTEDARVQGDRQRSSAGSRPSKAGMAVPAVPMYAAEVVERGDAAEGGAVGQVGGRRVESGGLRTIAPAYRAMAARAVGRYDLAHGRATVSARAARRDSSPAARQVRCSASGHAHQANRAAQSAPPCGASRRCRCRTRPPPRREGAARSSVWLPAGTARLPRLLPSPPPGRPPPRSGYSCAASSAVAAMPASHGGHAIGGSGRRLLRRQGRCCEEDRQDPSTENHSHPV